MDNLLSTDCTPDMFPEYRQAHMTNLVPGMLKTKIILKTFRRMILREVLIEIFVKDETSEMDKV